MLLTNMTFGLRLERKLMKKKLIKINTAYCDKFLRNTPRNLIWNNIDYILYNVVRRAIIATRFDLAQGSHQATCTKCSIQQNLTKSSSLKYTPRPHSKLLCESSRCSI